MTAANKLALVVEDEPEIRELMALQLQRNGFEVTSCATAEEGLYLLGRTAYDVILLDWMLPSLSGVEMIQGVRSGALNKATPILMVTAKVEPEDIVRGLEAGADDYLTKPFEVAVFIARVQALLRRARYVLSKNLVPDEVSVGSLRLDFKRHAVECGEQNVPVTRSEFKLLKALALEGGAVLSRERLISEVQGEGVAVVGRTVDTHVFGLRKKLGPCADCIETVRGIGYRLKFPAD